VRRFDLFICDYLQLRHVNIQLLKCYEFVEVYFDVNKSKENLCDRRIRARNLQRFASSRETPIRNSTIFNALIIPIDQLVLHDCQNQRRLVRWCRSRLYFLYHKWGRSGHSASSQYIGWFKMVVDKNGNYVRKWMWQLCRWAWVDISYTRIWFFYTIANWLDNFQNCASMNCQRNVNAIQPTRLPHTVASNKFWSSMSFQNLFRLSRIKNFSLIMPMSTKCQKNGN
jgi:hypothetical protein